jgi:tetratricopeptide (TPR) repeat protein
MARHPAPPDERLEELLDQAEDALGEDEPERALAAAEQALARAPRSIDALHYRAAALVALGRTDEAHEAYRAALKAAPDDLEVLRGAVDLLVVDLGEEHDALEDALDLCERALKLARRKGESGLVADFLFYSGVALGKLGQSRQARRRWRRPRACAPATPRSSWRRESPSSRCCAWKRPEGCSRPCSRRSPATPGPTTTWGSSPSAAARPRRPGSASARRAA